MGKMQREKGAGFEREVARLLADEVGMTFKRDLEQTRTAARGDLVDEAGAWPFVIECKRYASGNGCQAAWIAQAAEAAREANKWPSVVFRYNRRPVRVAVPLMAVSTDFGDTAEWVEMGFEAYCLIARELMATEVSA